jgi:hypothetical protein
MPHDHESLIVAPTFPYDMVQHADGKKTKPPEGWALLEPGDQTLTKRVKAAGPSWTVQQKKGRKVFSHGVWAPAETIETEREKLEAERETPEYKRKRAKALERKAKKHEEYVAEFTASVHDFLDFAPRYADLAQQLAEAVAAHATPVGSGTVARTERISVEERAERAVIAWMRHHTTSYDDMKIPRVKGKRRQVRRQLAQRSRDLLKQYRAGADMTDSCPISTALRQQNPTPTNT